MVDSLEPDIDGSWDGANCGILIGNLMISARCDLCSRLIDCSLVELSKSARWKCCCLFLFLFLMQAKMIWGFSKVSY